MDYSKILSVLKPLIIEQGKILKDAYFNLSPADLSNRYKENMDFITDLNEKIEDTIYTTLQKAFPKIGFNMEEHVDLDANQEYKWYIDSIDGMKYFAKGIHLFAMSVAIVKEGEPVLGLVYNPITERMFIGSETFPTSLNDNKITVSKTESISNSINFVSIIHHKLNGHQDYWEEDKVWVLDKLSELIVSSNRVRMIGLSSMEYAWIAAGAIDTSVLLTAKEDIKFLDHAAGFALIKYAGGKVLELEIPGLKSPRVIAGNPLIVDQIATILLKQK